MATDSVNAGLGLDYAYIVMLSDEGTYMIKVDSMENVDTESIDWEGLKDKFRKNAEKYMDSNTNISQTKLQKLFFDTLKSVNLQSKVSLY